MDLIEPHVVVTHDMIDFDVNNLYLEKDSSGLGLRVDVTKHEELSINLDKIVSNIRENRLNILRFVDDNMAPRVEKMKKRGWKIEGQYNWTPDLGPKFGSILTRVPNESPEYKKYEDLIVNHLQCRVMSMDQVQSYNLRSIYDAMKSQIKRENGGNANELLLFHGTAEDAAKGILDTGFDDRFFNNKFAVCRFGSGAYFANDIRKSHGYTDPKVTPPAGTRPVRVMFIVKVSLGKQFDTTEEMTDLRSAPKGFHSVHAKKGSTPPPNDYEEFIIYRYGQSCPLLMIKYQ
jgi:hypothetical protein